MNVINTTSQTLNQARAVIINVDDLGLSEAVNEAVIRLAKHGRIGASSYMVGGAISDYDIGRLSDLNVDIGLHLDLTGIFASSLQGSLKAIIIASYLRRLDNRQVSEIIQQQLDAFEDRFNQSPVFIDGHQHIHQFPVIRQCLNDELKVRYAKSTSSIYARATTPLVNDFKSWVIYLLGGKAWKQLCLDNNIVTNDRFGGVYGFGTSYGDLAMLWEKWLDSAPLSSNLSPGLYTQLNKLEDSGNYAQYGATTPPIHSVPYALPSDMMTTLIMCHPAVADNSWQDEIKAAREIEYNWLMSAEFESLLLKHKVRLVRWSELV